MTWTPVTINYDESMLPFFDAARREFAENDGIELTGIDWQVSNGKLVIAISKEQAERYLIQLGIKVGKFFARSQK